MSLKYTTKGQYIFKYIIMLIIILVSDDSLLFGTNIVRTYTAIKYGIYAVLAGILFLYSLYKRIKNNSGDIVIILLLCILPLVTKIIRVDASNGYVYRILVTVTAYLIMKIISKEEFFELFSDIMYILAVASLVLFAAYSVHFPLVQTLPQIENVAGNSYYSMFLSNISVETGGFLRNQGYFREPGLYQMYLNIAIMIEMFGKKKLNIKKIVVFVAALLTTFSTAGYIALFVIVAAFVFESDKGDSLKKVFILFAFVCVILYMYYFTDLLYKEGYGSVFGKISNSKSASANSRWASITVNLALAKEHILFGCGISEVTERFPIMAFREYNMRIVDNANNFLIQLSTFGIFYFALQVYLNYKFISLFSKKMITWIMLAVAIVGLYSGETVIYSLFFNTVVLYGLTAESRIRIR